MSEMLQRVRQGIVGSPLGRLLEIELVEIDQDRVVLRLPYRDEVTTVADQIHGGAIAALIDTAATAVAWSGVDPQDPPSRGTTVSLNVGYMAPARGRDLRAVATVPRRGRSICFCQVAVYDGDERQVAGGSAVYKLG